MSDADEDSLFEDGSGDDDFFDDDDFGLGDDLLDDADFKQLNEEKKRKAESAPTVDVNDPAYKEMVTKFSKSGSSMGTKRLCDELKYFYTGEAKAFGFGAELVEENLYHWRVFLTDFPDDCPLYKDLEQYFKRFGSSSSSSSSAPAKAAVELDIVFPHDFPFAPPFIRVLKPRFKFMTGHITIGGSICMEVLTASGWVPAYSLENLLMQIKSEMIGGGARLDFSNTSAYSVQEAKSAFDRMARKYNWKQ